MIRFKIRLRLTLAACAVAMLTPALAPANAQTIIDTWKSVQLPPPPELQPVTVDSAHTALLVLDMNTDNCVEAKRPSCARSIPHVVQLLKAARAHHMMVVYSGGPPTSTTSQTPPAGLERLPNEPVVRAAADKFYGTDLDKILAAGNIQTVIVVGTSTQAAVLYTATGASARNMKVVVPVDGVSSEAPFPELYALWHLKNGAGALSTRITLSKTDMITMN